MDVQEPPKSSLGSQLRREDSGRPRISQKTFLAYGPCTPDEREGKTGAGMCQVIARGCFEGEEVTCEGKAGGPGGVHLVLWMCLVQEETCIATDVTEDEDVEFEKQHKERAGV